MAPNEVTQHLPHHKCWCQRPFSSRASFGWNVCSPGTSSVPEQNRDPKACTKLTASSCWVCPTWNEQHEFWWWNYPLFLKQEVCDGVKELSSIWWGFPMPVPSILSIISGKKPRPAILQPQRNREMCPCPFPSAPMWYAATSKPICAHVGT